ncbi:hypothetical protein [Sphingomonas panaciterrae]|uniref:hypothetical protein n=1 Tax=Sphingomonas panaciterrae TaxID=1462999 RepID=UPI002FF1DD80
MSTLTYSARSIELSWEDLFKVSTGTGVGALDEMERARMFRAAWTIIDSIHVGRRLMPLLIRKGAEPPKDVSRFIEAASVASKMRNRMDHVDQSISNLSASKSKGYPLFGSIYYWTRDIEDGRADALAWHSSGPYVGKDVSLDYFENEFLEADTKIAGHFMLSSFNMVFDIDKAILLFKRALKCVGDGFRDSFLKSLAAVGEEERKMLVLPALSGDEQSLYFSVSDQ